MGSAGIIIVLATLFLTLCFWIVDLQLRMWYPRRQLKKGEKYSPVDYSIHMGLVFSYYISGGSGIICRDHTLCVLDILQYRSRFSRRVYRFFGFMLLLDPSTYFLALVTYL